MPNKEPPRDQKVYVQHRDGYEKRTRTTENPNAERRAAVSKAANIIWWLVAAVEILIGLRVLLKLLAANPGNPIAMLIYTISEFFLWPFWGLTITPAAQGMVLEIPSLIAMVVYALLGWLIVRLVWVIFYHPTSSTTRTIEREVEHHHEVE